MNFITIDCTEIKNKAAFHAAVAEALSLPEWYGKNLDALHDCLTEIYTDTRIQFENWTVLGEALGPYSAAIQWSMTHAAGDNPNIQVWFD